MGRPPYKVTAPSADEIQKLPEGEWWNVTVVIKCTAGCNELKTFSVPYPELRLYEDGATHIQDAMPNLSAGYREMFITGICPDCFDKVMPPEDEDDEPS